MGLDLARRCLGGIHVVPVEKVDRLGDHLHVPQFLGGDVQKQILDLRVFDAKALGHILHRRLELAVPAAELLLQQCRVLRIGTFDLYRVKQHFFVLKHNLIS